jgi:hypothetical protein
MKDEKANLFKEAGRYRSRSRTLNVIADRNV